MTTKRRTAAQLTEMPELDVQPLMKTPIVSVRDVCCRAPAGTKSAENAADARPTVSQYLVSTCAIWGREEPSLRRSQVLFFNSGESYQVSASDYEAAMPVSTCRRRRAVA